MGVEFDPVLKPRDLGPGVPLRHAEESDLPSQHVLELEMARFYYFSSLKHSQLCMGIRVEKIFTKR
jgi:hypothetical protein